MDPLNWILWIGASALEPSVFDHGHDRGQFWKGILTTSLQPSSGLRLSSGLNDEAPAAHERPAHRQGHGAILGPQVFQRGAQRGQRFVAGQAGGLHR